MNEKSEAQGNDEVSTKNTNLENKGSEATSNDEYHTKENGKNTQEKNGELVNDENLENSKDNKEVKDNGLVEASTEHENSTEEKGEHIQGGTEVSMNGKMMHTKSGNADSNKENEVEVQGESIGDTTKDVNLENKEDLKRGNEVI